MEKSVSHALSFEFLALVVSRFWHKMRGSGLPLCLLSAVFSLSWAPSASLKTLHLGSCVITTNLQGIRSGFAEIQSTVQTKDEILDIRILKKTHSLQDTTPAYQCCLLRHILRLYLDRVFKNYQTPDHHVLRKVSSLANSFLAIKKDLRLCHAHLTCPCGEEAMEKYSQILSHFEELQPQAAVVKALGELDILLRWIEAID
ncbi:interleukin-20 [Camelus ferus]|uniref:Interleukin family protein n=1 Tax=Camelus ferus TaxID=419612 RepID=A0A8B6YEH3_CAMFR|nr:interleukin-20 [Camelus ferus]